jgi:SAM-dependent methyltransferase
MGCRNVKEQRSLFLTMDRFLGSHPITEEPARGTALACLLCGSNDSRCMSKLSSADLSEAWSQLEVRFSEQAWAVLCGRGEVELLECQGCGFRFFDRSLAGEGTFYAELQKQIPTYYSSVRPEFKWTLKQARKLSLRTVLDVGCGTGSFLDLAKGAGLVTHGLELNVQAAEISRRKGHCIYPSLLDELELEQPAQRFDLITAFQVLEHVVDPLRFLRDAKRLIKDRGFIAVGVPNEKGLHCLCPWDPHQWPPHHITRWRPADLRNLCKPTQLELVRLGSDPLLGGEAEHFWNLHNKVAAALGKKKYPGNSLLPGCLSLLYRFSGCKFVFPRRGPNIYALYRPSIG